MNKNNFVKIIFMFFYLLNSNICAMNSDKPVYINGLEDIFEALELIIFPNIFLIKEYFKVSPFHAIKIRKTLSLFNRKKSIFKKNWKEYLRTKINDSYLEDLTKEISDLIDVINSLNFNNYLSLKEEMIN